MSLRPVGWLGQDADRHEHCYPKHKTIEASTDVFAEGFKVVRVGDAVASHGGSCNKHPSPHSAKVEKGSASVFVNGKAMAREGDTVRCATGETASLLRGRATVVAGDASPNNSDAEQGDGPRLPVVAPPNGASAAARRAPGRDPVAVIGAIRRVLSYSPTGKQALEVIDRYGTGIVFTRGGGGYYDPRSNTITLDENFTFEQTVLTLVHEANHVDADHSGAGSGRKVMLLSRANFVNDMLTEEATGDLLAAMVAEELAGVIVPAQGAGYSKAALDSFQGKAYLAGRQQGISALLAKQPGASPDAVFRAGVEGARAAMIQEFRNGSLRPSTGASLNYVLYYGTFWDKNRSNRSGPGY